MSGKSVSVLGLSNPIRDIREVLFFAMGREYPRLALTLALTH